MNSEISRKVRKKAYLLFREGKVKKELETDKRIHFKVFGKTEVHSVIFDKEKGVWSCDCSWNTLKKKECSHIFSSRLLERKELR